MTTARRADPELTVGRYLTEIWLPGVRAVLRPGTYSSYAMNVRTHMVPGLGSLRLSDLDPPTINAFYGRLLDGGPRPPLARSTIRRLHATLRRALRDAVRWGYLGVNPAGDADPPWVPHREMPAWDIVQLRTFLAGARSDPRYELWLFYALTGTRRGEALGLRWSDVDLEARRVSIRRAHLMVDHHLWVGETKTVRGRRTIAIDGHLTAALAELRRRETDRGRGRNQDLVFVRPDGAPWNPEQVTRWFARLANELHLPRLTLHGLRHSHATCALAAGVDAKIISVRLGHAHMGVTADLYQHALPGLDRDAAERMARLIVPDPEHQPDGASKGTDHGTSSDPDTTESAEDW
ncbi:MAG TPA: tyrosine-type recombinase/integrase [Acidimicrobiales bacterium]|nr:tyrosine-type recombinase/integrase [Acidimicrobiales bacterium]